MTYHAPVLLKEVVTWLQPRSGGVYVDATVGGGGHAAEILKVSGPEGRVLGLDWDDEALGFARERLKEFGARVELVRANFVEVEPVLMEAGVTTVNGVVFDLGVSSWQLDEPARGFSFLREGPLDMRMDRRLGATARDVLRTASLEELADIFFKFGDERRSRAIARAVGRARDRNALPSTTTELAALVERVLGPKRGRLHPATRVFQALRIATNDELQNLRRGLAAAVRVLGRGGRIVTISFHSLEDRIVKEFFREQARGDAPVLKVLTKKPVTPQEAEVAGNPRARSAKLRVAERIN